jgi:DNA-nicking Smr family endonuclease
VITGKGRSPASSDSIAAYESERGILRRNVPRWLEEPDVRNIVVSFTTAAIRHGGEGALYVHLRSSRRS